MQEARTHEPPANSILFYNRGGCLSQQPPLTFKINLMQKAIVNTIPMGPRSKKFISPALIILLLLAAGYIFYQYMQLQPVFSKKTIISQSALEEQYGLRVNLVAVTAAGGMVDLRLKIVDGEKAKLLLTDKNNFPAIYVGARGIILNAEDDTKLEEIKFEDGNNIFLIYPNAGGAVQRGTAVNIMFGDIALEPIIAK